MYKMSPSLYSRLVAAAVIFALSSSGMAEVFAQGSKGGRNQAQAAGRMNVGIELLKNGKNDQALKAFEEAVRLDPNLPAAYNNIGRIYADRENSEKAIYYFKRAIGIEPLYEPALSNLGLVLYSTGKAEDAIHPWRLCLKGEGKDSPTMHYYLANALRDVGNKADKDDRDVYLREARDNYMTAIKLDPQFAAAYSGLSVVDLSEGRLDDARKAVTTAIKLKPDSSFSHYHLGLIEERLGHKQLAIKAFEQSIKYESVPRYKQETRDRIAGLKGESPKASTVVVNDSAAQLRLEGEAALKKRDWSRAARIFEALSTRGGDPIILNNLGYAQANQGQLAAAVANYRKALALKEPFMEAQFNLGMALRRAADNAGAEAAFRKSIDDAATLKKANPVAQNMLGIILRERNDNKGADRAFRKAILQSGGELAVANFNLGVLLEREERTREAVQEYRTYLKRAPKGENAANARERLKRLTGSAG